LGEDRADFADDVSDGASADVEQLGERVVGAQAALVKHGGQYPLGVGDLLGEDPSAGAGQPFSAATSVSVALGQGGEIGSGACRSVRGRRAARAAADGSVLLRCLTRSR